MTPEQNTILNRAIDRVVSRILAVSEKHPKLSKFFVKDLARYEKLRTEFDKGVALHVLWIADHLNGTPPDFENLRRELMVRD